jgi:hypothetical protein
MSERTIEQAMQNAARLRAELPMLIQPTNTDRDMVVLAAEIESLRSRLAEAERVISLWAEWDRAADFYRRCKADPKSSEVGAMRDAVEWLCSLAAKDPADSAPAVQPCGHPWKAQHDFKCILCSSPGPAPCDATSAQLAEAQRFLHGTPAGGW